MDTSKVTFGARHEGTGMVLLQHSLFDHPAQWGDDRAETKEFHSKQAAIGYYNSDLRAAHAALAEVREALNTAEAHGAEVQTSDHASCWGWRAWDDDTESSAEKRAHRFLTREVQALVDQGLRGDDLNARLPYPVRDHRVQEADTSSDDQRRHVVINAIETAENVHSTVDLADAVLAALDAHRARREGGA